jgi:para-nitrobenzyl esterase
MGIGVVTTKYGKISGVKQDGYTVFKGVRYAKPPVGELRFAPPAEPEPWEGIQRADTFGKMCAQFNSNDEGFYKKEFYSHPDFQFEMDEDGLFLNVWTPADSSTDRLPVAMWLHGGAYMGGCGSELEFDGEALAKKGVILVTVNYRLGALGFLAHPWLTKESPNHVSGNYGTLDQIAALRYVRENIAAFGGNPESITVFGQSAGCMSTQTLITSPLSRNMISKAILQSGGGYHFPLFANKTLADAERAGERFVACTGAKSLEELRALPVERILQAQVMFFMDALKSGAVDGLPFAPVIDGYVLTEGYDTAIENNNIAHADYLIGSTRNDITVTSEMLAAGEKSPVYQSSAAFSLKLEELGRAPAYVYYFTRQLPGDDAGAFHSSELWYMFGTLDRCWRPSTEADYALSDRMVSYWANFIKSGDPNGEGLPAWEKHSMGNPFVEILDID